MQHVHYEYLAFSEISCAFGHSPFRGGDSLGISRTLQDDRNYRKEKASNGLGPRRPRVESDEKFQVEMPALEISCQEVSFEFMTAGARAGTVAAAVNPLGAWVWSEE